MCVAYMKCESSVASGVEFIKHVSNVDQVCQVHVVYVKCVSNM